MNTITLKNVPAGIHKTLKSRAKAHGRSLNKEIIVSLEATLHGVRVNTAEVVNHARAVRETAGVYLTQADLTAFKNTGRR
ncbi:Arc family DNA-binding protein [Verrucomicrobiota bacterium]